MLEDISFFIWHFCALPYALVNFFYGCCFPTIWRTQNWCGCPKWPLNVNENQKGDGISTKAKVFDDGDKSVLIRVRSYFAVKISAHLLPLIITANIFCVWNIKRTWIWYLPYAFWCLVLGERYGWRLGRPNSWVRKWRLWQYAVEYFPMIMQKENTDTIYPTNKNYLIGFHPHGIIGVSYFTQFGGEIGLDWNSIARILPGLDIRLTTLDLNMRLPFGRHLLQGLGFVSCCKDTIRDILKNGQRKACVLVLGGAKEALLTSEMTNDVIVRRRRGFFELALQTGATLIPVYALGENDVFCSPNSVITSWISVKTMRYLGFSIPIFYGRGLFQLFMPKRVPIYTVIGNPIDCPQVEFPSDEDVEKLRGEYCTALKRVFYRAKSLYRPRREFNDIRIVE